MFLNEKEGVHFSSRNLLEQYDFLVLNILSEPGAQKINAYDRPRLQRTSLWSEKITIATVLVNAGNGSAHQQIDKEKEHVAFMSCPLAAAGPCYTRCTIGAFIDYPDQIHFLPGVFNRPAEQGEKVYEGLILHEGISELLIQLTRSGDLDVEGRVRYTGGMHMPLSLSASSIPGKYSRLC